MRLSPIAIGIAIGVVLAWLMMRERQAALQVADKNDSGPQDAATLGIRG